MTYSKSLALLRKNLQNRNNYPLAHNTKYQSCISIRNYVEVFAEQHNKYNAINSSILKFDSTKNPLDLLRQFDMNGWLSENL